MAVPISVCVLVYLLSNILANIIIEKVFIVIVQKNRSRDFVEIYVMGSPELDKVDLKKCLFGCSQITLASKPLNVFCPNLHKTFMYFGYTYRHDKLVLKRLKINPYFEQNSYSLLHFKESSFLIILVDLLF